MSDEKAEAVVDGERAQVRVSLCREETCKARMIWARGPKGGKLPLDAEPSEKGPYVLTGPPRDLVAAYAPEGTSPDRRHASHFQTCPAARRFSQKGKGNKPWREPEKKRVAGPTQMPRAKMTCPDCGTVVENAPMDARCAVCFDRVGIIVPMLKML